jgi:hypothetical protein
MRFTLASGLISASLALGASSIPLAASAGVPFVPVPQPPGAACTAVKIVSTGASSWSVMNCSNNLGYLIINKVAAVIPLGLPPGATSERVYDVALKGYSVGVATFPVAPFKRAVEWNPGGAPALLGPPGTAAGIDQFGQPIVGFLGTGAAMRAFWYMPGPSFIAPATSAAYDVNRQGVDVGQLNGVAAAGGHALAALAGFPAAPPSVAYAINETSLIVGHLQLAGACAGGSKGIGFSYPWAPGPPSGVGPLPGDCDASAEDDNDPGAIVGYSRGPHPLPKQAMGLNLPLPWPPGLININASVSAGGLCLTDAPGVDNNAEVIATGGCAPPSQVFILN